MVSEFSLINKIGKKFQSRSKRVTMGIGDDAAILKSPKGKLLATVDCLVEGVHFDLKYFKPEDVGHKALAVNLSDIAAMGGIPRYALVSLGIRSGLDEKFIMKFYSGLSKLAKKYEVHVVGGNITRSRQFFADVTVLGEASRPLLRKGARVGDLVTLSGSLGQAALGLKYLKTGKKNKLTKKQLRPEPRVDLGQRLAHIKGIHACIDISDGLSSELWHVSRTSNVKIQIEAQKIEWNSGEDYELLVFLDALSLRSLSGELTVIGRVVGKGTGVFALENGKKVKVSPKGWDHLTTNFN